MINRNLSAVCMLMLATLLLGGLLACSSTTIVGRGGEIEGIPWMLTEYSASGSMKTVPNNVNATAKFEDGKFSGQVVNSCGGSYNALPSGSLAITQITATTMAGPPEAMAVEQAYLAALQKTASYTSDGLTLKLYGKDGRQLLVFKKYDVSIFDYWKVTAYNHGGGALVPVVGRTGISLLFARDGRVMGTDEISGYYGAYSTSGVNGITIVGTGRGSRPPGSPIPQQIQDQATAYHDALQAAKVYRVQDDALELRDDTGAVEVQAMRAE